MLPKGPDINAKRVVPIWERLFFAIKDVKPICLRQTKMTGLDKVNLGGQVARVECC